VTVNDAPCGETGPVAIDFARSYLVFRSTRVDHTPRLQLDAACSLTGPDGATRRFVLTCPCIGEHMYVPAGLIQEPPYEFLMVAEHRREYAIHRRHASAARDSREAHRLGEAMSTVSGVPAPVTALDVSLATHKSVRQAASQADLRAALDNGWPVVGRTSYLAEDGETTVLARAEGKPVATEHYRDVRILDARNALYCAAG
jgi:hypothetical protein